MLITGTSALNGFEKFFTEHYDLLKSDAKRFFNTDTFEDELTNIFLKARERIIKSGITVNDKWNDLNRTFYAFVWRSMGNRGYDVRKNKGNKQQVYSIDNPNLQTKVQQALEDSEHSKLVYYDSLEVLNEELFNYVTIYNNEIDSNLYKSWIATSRISYEKFAELTNYPKQVIKNILSRINKDIRANFICWLTFERTKWYTIKHHPHFYVSVDGLVKNKNTLEVYERSEVYEFDKDGLIVLKSVEQLILSSIPVNKQSYIYNRIDVRNMITKEEGVEIIKQEFSTMNFNKYRELHYILFKTWPGTCNCNSLNLYNKLREYCSKNNLI